MDQGNTAFVLFSAAFVLLMTPGLAFFYGGLTTRSRSPKRNVTVASHTPSRG